MNPITNQEEFEQWLRGYRNLWLITGVLCLIAGICVGVIFFWELMGLVMIVKTYHRKESRIDTQNVQTILGVACPFCPNKKRFTGKNIAGTDRRLIYCGVCGASFYEDEGRNG